MKKLKPLMLTKDPLNEYEDLEEDKPQLIRMDSGTLPHSYICYNTGNVSIELPAGSSFDPQHSTPTSFAFKTDDLGNMIKISSAREEPGYWTRVKAEWADRLMLDQFNTGNQWGLEDDDLSGS